MWDEWDKWITWECPNCSEEHEDPMGTVTHCRECGLEVIAIEGTAVSFDAADEWVKAITTPQQATAAKEREA